MTGTSQFAIKKPVIFGFLGSLFLLIIYFGILSFANSFTHAIQQFSQMWYWILLLAVGFGIQIGLYTHVRYFKHENMAVATTEIAATGGVSTGSMVACCAHHVTDVLPIIGLSGAALFLSQYQVPFIILGLFSNLVGIAMMLNIMQKHDLFHDQSLFKGLFKYDMKFARNSMIVISVIIVSIAFINVSGISSNIPLSTGAIATGDALSDQHILESKVSDENSVTVSAKPIDFSFNSPVKFDMAIETHTVSLDFDVAEISFLEDGNGNIYEPISWEGSPPGGHHRSGILSFPELNGETSSLKLTIEDVSDVPERVFVWDLE